MFESALFMGYPIDESLEKALKRARPELVDFWIDNNKEYLHEAEFGGDKYLGKFLEECETATRLTLVEGNIISLIQKLATNWNPANTEAVLFAVAKNG